MGRGLPKCTLSKVNSLNDFSVLSLVVLSLLCMPASCLNCVVTVLIGLVCVRVRNLFLPFGVVQVLDEKTLRNTFTRKERERQDASYAQHVTKDEIPVIHHQFHRSSSEFKNATRTIPIYCFSLKFNVSKIFRL